MSEDVEHEVAERIRRLLEGTTEAATDETKGVTMQEMCETISAYWKRTRGVDVAPERIFNYSPSGELSRVFEWYQEALAAGE